LVAGGGGIFVVRVSTHQVVSIIPTAPSYDGTGTLATTPSGDFALASGGANQVTVIAAPFGPSSLITTVPLPGAVAQQTTQAIVFDPKGRAFIYQQTGLSVLDPPYSGVTFTIPITNLNPGRVAITPDGNQVLATTDVGFGLKVFTSPFAPSSVPALISIPASPGGIAVVPDGSKALVSSDNSTRLFAVSAPYNSSSMVEEIQLAAVFAPSADIGISGDGQLAVLAGQGGFATPDIAFVRAPFTAAGASVFDVRIPGGRGNGAVRFASASSVVAVPASSWPMRLLAFFGIALAALFQLGRLRSLA
jgi:DNA-binding beta-propeller fold protein YncE